jgi:hypothetical protein
MDNNNYATIPNTSRRNTNPGYQVEDYNDYDELDNNEKVRELRENRYR